MGTEFASAGLTAGQLNAIVTKLGGHDAALKFLRGELTVSEPTPPIIDCDATPVIPSGWKVKEKDQLPGRVRGQFVWDPAKVKLHLSPNQQGGKIIEGNKLKEELANKPVLTANVLDFLLRNPHLIPENWKKDENGNIRFIYFWGTIYRDSGGCPCVRGLYFSGGGWRWGYDWLGVGWSDGDPAALRAS